MLQEFNKKHIDKTLGKNLSGGITTLTVIEQNSLLDVLPHVRHARRSRERKANAHEKTFSEDYSP